MAGTDGDTVYGRNILETNEKSNKNPERRSQLSRLRYEPEISRRKTGVLFNLTTGKRWDTVTNGKSRYISTDRTVSSPCLLSSYNNHK
jgi:hypothetical protein